MSCLSRFAVYVLWLLVLVVGLMPMGSLGYALPLETFNAPLSIECGEGQRECSGVLRVANSLGHHTGVSIVKSLGGEVSLRTGRPQGALKLEADDVSDLTVTFSWDGDSNPDVLSGSGLNCLDMTRGGAYAVIISKLSAEPECRDGAIPSECPHFTVDSRVYDSQDPTGQRFSASIVVRGAMTASDLAVPFSNFVRSGPRGKGSFTCAGAVTITMRFSGLEDLELELGPIYTNGEEGLDLPPTVVPATPTPMPSAAETAASKSEAVSAVLSVPDVVATASPKAVGTVPPDSGATPAATKAAEESPSHQTSQTPIVSPKESKVPAAPRAQRPPEEVVYGSVVLGQ